MSTKIWWSIEWMAGKGSQAKLLPTVNSTNVMISMHNRDKGRAWAVITPDRLPKLISSNRGIYEIIINRKRKVYFDIDHYGETDTVDQCKKVIRDVLHDAQLQISGSIETDVLLEDKQISTTKYSYHIVVNNYHVDNLEECAGIRGFCQSHEELGFDWKVYTKNRAMKCINQSKIGKPVQTFIEGNSDVRSHLITSFFDSDSKNATTYFNEWIEPTEPIIFNSIKQKHDIVPSEIKDITEPVHLVRLIPRDHDHRVTYTVALYFLYLGKSFEDFWNWAQDKNNTRNRLQRWQTYHWPKLLDIHNQNNNHVNDNVIIKLVER